MLGRNRRAHGCRCALASATRISSRAFTLLFKLCESVLYGLDFNRLRLQDGAMFLFNLQKAVKGSSPV